MYCRDLQPHLSTLAFLYMRHHFSNKRLAALSASTLSKCLSWILCTPLSVTGMQASSRDALARHLGQTAAAKLRTRAASARRTAQPLTPGAMPPPTSGLRRKPDGTPSRTPLSSAGRKLAQSLHGRMAAADAQLRASYSSSPAQHAAGATSGQRDSHRSVTPARTPVRHPAAADPSSAAPGSAASKGSLTDDLLNI